MDAECQDTLHNLVTQPLRGENYMCGGGVGGIKGHDSTNLTANLIASSVLLIYEILPKTQENKLAMLTS